MSRHAIKSHPGLYLNGAPVFGSQSNPDDLDNIDLVGKFPNGNPHSDDEDPPNGEANTAGENNGPAAQDPDEDKYPEKNQLPPHQSQQVKVERDTHPFLSGDICDEQGAPAPPNTNPPPRPNVKGDWNPFKDQTQFQWADFVYTKLALSKGNVRKPFLLLTATMLPLGGQSSWKSIKELHTHIDQIQQGDAPWERFNIKYSGPRPAHNVPSWMDAEHEIWTRDVRLVAHQMMQNPDYKNKFNTAPYREYKAGTTKQRWSNLMSGNWAWREADLIQKENTANCGAMLVPLVLEADKTTVSIGTGDTVFHPLYLSLGIFWNNVQQGHRNAVMPIAFLAIPKSDRIDGDDKDYLTFCRQLYQRSVSRILEPLRAAMTTPEVVWCPGSHFRRAIFSIGPFIADYPEQCMLACIVQGWCPRCDAKPKDLDGAGTPRSQDMTDFLVDQWKHKKNALWNNWGIVKDVVPFTNNFPRADIHKLLSGNLLHQVIKGAFKDHIVEWISAYPFLNYSKAEAERILDEVDRQIAAMPSYPGLQHFKQGHGYKQWTGGDSKALMKVYLAAIRGLLPLCVVKCVSAFMEFCYIARHDVIDNDALVKLDTTLALYFHHRHIFEESGVCPDGFGLPRSHALPHYRLMIMDFGAPNGLCLSITESKHIAAVKKPWRRSSKYNAMRQMLLINQHLDKLAAARVSFTALGMLEGSLEDKIRRMFPGVEEGIGNDKGEDELPQHNANPLPAIPEEEPEDDFRDDEDGNGDDQEAGPEDGPRTQGSVVLAKTRPHELDFPSFPGLVRRFIWDQFAGPDDPPSSQIQLGACPMFDGKIDVFHSAVARFFAPSDLCGTGGMHRETIRSTCSWCGPDNARHNCVFTNNKTGLSGFRGMHARRVMLFFLFKFKNKNFPCALVQMFSAVGHEVDDETGMWMVEPDLDEAGEREMRVIHLDTIIRGAHLPPVFGKEFIGLGFDHYESLNAFDAYFINKYIDHHASKIMF